MAVHIFTIPSQPIAQSHKRPWKGVTLCYVPWLVDCPQFTRACTVPGCDGVGRAVMPGNLRENARCPVDRTLSMVVVHVVVAAEALGPFAQAIGGYTRCDSNRIRKIAADAGRTLAGLHSSATIVPAQTGHLGVFRVNYSYVSPET